MNGMNNIWIHQTWNYGLGNFINLTPAIKMMSDRFGKRVLVYFDLRFVRQCFLDCPFIEILETKPAKQSLFGSWLINARNDCPDYINAYREVCKSIPLEGELPHTYVDQAKRIKVKEKDYTLFIRGAGNESNDYLINKMPDDSYYRDYMKGNCIFTGSENDQDRAGPLFDSMNYYVGNIRESLALIREAKLVVSNDSGLAHAAGAMNKNMVILWKNTSLPKNANPGKNTMIKMCHG